jgi:hypothetical protein
MLPEDGCETETCRSNFNVNFNVLLSKYIVHPLVKIKRTLIMLKISFFLGVNSATLFKSSCFSPQCLTLHYGEEL